MPTVQKSHKMPMYIVTILEGKEYQLKLVSSNHQTRFEVLALSFKYDIPFETDDKGDFTTQLHVLHTLNKVIIITRIDVLIQT